MNRHFDKVSTRVWCAAELGGAELVRGRFADYAYDPHSHDTACFALITRGAIRIRTRGESFVARAGDLYAIDADELHAGWPVDDRGWSLRTLYVDIRRLGAMVAGQEAVATPSLAGPIIRDRDLSALFQGFHSCSEAGGPALKRQEAYLSFGARLFQRHARCAAAPPGPAREPAAVRRARDFINGHVDQRFGLDEIAAAAGLPPFRLLRAFQRSTGLSPHAYQRQARLRLAAGLLRLGHAPGPVAAAAGFADQAHLTRTFRRTLGITPGAYRDAHRGR